MGLCLSLALPFAGKAQFSITAYPPPSDFTFEDLWHFTASGPGSSNFTEFYVALRIFDESGNLLLKSNSSPFALNNGTLYINKTLLSSISPLTTIYYETLYQNVVSNGDFFPPGTYNIFLTLNGRPTDGEYSELAEDNYTAVVQIFLPPLLVYPEDMDTIDIPNPVLTWLPAYQAANGQQILYDLRLVEMFPWQTSQQAISANPVYMEQLNLNMTALPYPVGGNNLQLNHTYAWQVTATINGAPVGYSQIWQFTYALPEPDTTDSIYNRQFYSLFANQDGAIVPIRTPFVPLRVEEIYIKHDHQLAFAIYNESGEIIASSQDIAIQVIHGTYFIEVPICGNPINLEMNKPYMIETSNSKNQKRYIRILNQFDPINCD